jgi:hypothetical protein
VRGGGPACAVCGVAWYGCGVLKVLETGMRVRRARTEDGPRGEASAACGWRCGGARARGSFFLGVYEKGVGASGSAARGVFVFGAVRRGEMWRFCGSSFGGGRVNMGSPSTGGAAMRRLREQSARVFASPLAPGALTTRVDRSRRRSLWVFIDPQALLMPRLWSGFAGCFMHPTHSTSRFPLWGWRISVRLCGRIEWLPSGQLSS